MGKSVTREQFSILTDYIDVDHDLELTDADFESDGERGVTESEFHAAFDDAMHAVYLTQSPDERSFNADDLEEFKTSLTYNKFQQWGKFFAESDAETMPLRDDGFPENTEVLGGIALETDHAFTGTVQDADVSKVRRGSEEVPIYAPRKAGTLPDNEITISDALLKTDPDVLPLVHSVTINPIRNPSDSYWAKEYRTPGFTSYMNAGAAGQITVFPTGADPLWTETSLTHEIGHVWSNGRWTSDHDNPHWDSWKTASRLDGAAPTAYSDSAPGEDFGDSFMLYFYFRGTPRPDGEALAKLRGWYPELFVSLDASPKDSYFDKLAEAFPNRFALLQEIATHELSGPLALDSGAWEKVHDSYVAAEFLEAQGRRDEAAREYEKIIAIDSGQNEAKRLLSSWERDRGYTAYGSGDYETAATHYAKAYALNPYDTDAKDGLVNSRLAQGNDRWQKGDFGGAALFYAKAHELEPGRADIKDALLYLYKKSADDALAAGDPFSAAAQYERALALDPQNQYVKSRMETIHVEHGNAALETGNDAEALVHYEKLLVLDPTYPGAAQAMLGCHKRLAALAVEEDRDADAKTHYEAVLKLEPTNQEASDYVNGVTRVLGYELPSPF